MIYGLALIWTVFAFFVCDFMGYAFHRFLHTKYAGPFHRNHLVHHLEKYPANDFTSPDYRKAGKANTLWPFLATGLFIGAVALWLTPLWFSLPLIFNLSLVGYLNDTIHESTHLNPTKLVKYQWFRVLRDLHLQHHLNLKTNYGIFSFWADRLAGTYRLPSQKARTRFKLDK